VSAALGVGLGVIGIAVGVAAGFWLRAGAWRPRAAERPRAVRRILLPFTELGISRRAFEAAVRLAQAEGATIMPAFLARVPRQLPLDSALPVQCGNGMPLLEAVEQRASSQGVSVDSRVARGRTYRDALRRLLQSEQVDRVIVSATDSPNKGLTADDLEWLLERVPAEILILRPAPQDTRQITPEAVAGHF
jgi:hypothetical protein